MKRNACARKVIAWLLSLVMLAGLLAVPVLAEGEDAPAAPAAAASESSSAKSEAPAAKSEAPAAKSEAPAAKAEAPAAKSESSSAASESSSAKSEAPAAKAEAPAAASESSSTKSEAPAAKEEAPAAKEEAPSAKEEAPAAKEEAPAAKEEAPAAKEEAPVAKEEAPAAAGEETPAAPAVTTRPSRPSRPAQSVAVEVVQEDSGDNDLTIVTDSSAAAAAPAEEDDGFTVDWAEVGTLPGGDWQIGEWGAARGEGGYYIYMTNSQNQTSIGITYDHSPSDAIRYREWMFGGNKLVDETDRMIENAPLTVIKTGNSVRMEAFIPDSFFKETGFVLSSGNVTLRSEDIPRLDDATDPQDPDPVSSGTGKEVDESTIAQDIGAAYTGITIDGKFSDWDAVPRYDLKDTYDAWGNVKDWDTVDHVSVVWDGDWVYILLVADGTPADYDPTVMVGNWTSVCNAGPNGNGQFAIVTDLNQQLLIQPNANTPTPSISGIDDAQVAVNNKDWAGAPHMWEIAVPAERLPKYLESFEFGLYLVAPAITGITDLQGGTDEDKSFNGVVIDGKFADWNYYPMTTIEYATPGTQDIVRDAHGALWADGSTLYGYVATNMIAHLGAQGGDFLADIALAFNGDRSYKEYPTDGNFYPRIVTFDSEGNLITLNEGVRLENGDYTFYIYDDRTDPSFYIAPKNELNQWEQPTMQELIQGAFGIMKVHVDGVLDQAEFQLDLNKVAAYIDKDGDTAFRNIEIQWGRLGQQWIAIAGTPTGPIVSVALLVGAIGGPVCVAEARKRHLEKKRKDEDDEK